MFKKFLFIVSLVVIATLGILPTMLSAQVQPVDKVTIEVFERLECTHCQNEKAFLTDLASRRDDFVVNFYDIAETQNRDNWVRLAELKGLPKVTPITIIGTTVIQGFDQPETTGRYFEQLIDDNKTKPRLTLEEFLNQGASGEVQKANEGCDEHSDTCSIGSSAVPLFVSLPFIGPIDVEGFSLGGLSMVLGFVDGFNPCAMWVLVTFLIVLAQVGDRRRMWQVAGLFIVAEAIMYYLILNVWFTAWDFVGLDGVITPLVGLVAIGGGIFFLYEWRKSDGTCKVTNYEQRSKTSRKIRDLVSQPFTILTVVGVIALAFSVNIIEFACSIGIPQAYTKIIELNNPGFWLTQWFMGLYILFYMVDDLIVFGIALYSFEKIGLTTKYSKWSNLVGGILMIMLGLILIFKRSWLVF
ncbi:MAG: glutaredoxin [Candidatus Buchananbacteria bacterium]|nr:glutaredoxin [Candidatus Buchananbacteria bacterium]